MRRLGIALSSQCETDEPPSQGFGVNMTMWPWPSAPAYWLRSRPRRAVAGRFARSFAPSESETSTDGIVMVASVPPMSIGDSLPLLSATITPVAPASCAFFTLTVKLQFPRSTRAILPVTAGAFVSALQAVVVDPAESAAAVAAMTCPETERAEIAGPKLAVPIVYAPAAAAGAETKRPGLPRLRNESANFVAPGPVQKTFPAFVVEARRCVFVIWSHVFPRVASNRNRSKAPGMLCGKLPVVDETLE